ncbi:FAD-dependent thiol oxidase [Hanseniaspora valbyensis NRRL Y-1626]|uniref:Sulfhydryl oxidase n=1 Tax=Hanseniaspora valbyensis NRRL Y-1626 TaxID=766949 RepID=A0A1B7TK43_9ASCO|nr:FAD-dependent thiol oxidase [Hanseniaspora valbyensis NRRL Y-1626]
MSFVNSFNFYINMVIVFFKCVSQKQKKQLLYVFYSILIVLVFKYTIFNNNDSSSSTTTSSTISTKTVSEKVVDKQDTIYKDTIMPLMPDLAKKQELGRHAWYLFHTTLSRYPDEPSEAQQTKLKNYIELFAEFYPCGECSYHFQQLLEKNPIQVKSRQTAAMWEDYDCGCGEFSEFNKDTDSGDNKKITVNKEDKQQG